MKISPFDVLLPEQVKDEVQRSLDQLAIALDTYFESAQVDSQTVARSSIPPLFDVYSRKFSGIVPRDNPAQAVSIFARSVSAFADHIMRSQEFNDRDDIPSEGSIASIYAAFCASGELFAIDGQVSRKMDKALQIKLTRALQSFVQVIGPFSKIAESAIGSEGARAHARSLMEHIEVIGDDDVDGVMRAIEFCYSMETLNYLQSFISAYEKWFRTILGESVNKHSSEALRFLKAGGDDAAESHVNILTQDIADCVDLLARIGKLVSPLRSELGLQDGSDIPTIPHHDEWNTFIKRAIMFRHDYAGILMALNGTVSLLNSAGLDRNEVILILEDVLLIADISTVKSLIKMICGLSRHSAESNEINIQFGRLPAIAIPEQHRSAMLRIANELLCNAIKNYDKKKKLRTIMIDTVEVQGSDSRHRLNFLDNGVGMKDPDNAVLLFARERPEEIEGEGIGLASCSALASDIGCELSFDSRDGYWTRATLEIDIEAWGNGAGGPPATSAMPSLPAGGIKPISA